MDTMFSVSVSLHVLDRFKLHFHIGAPCYTKDPLLYTAGLHSIEYRHLQLKLNCG